MRRAPNAGKILAVGTLALVAVGLFRTWVEAQGPSYVRQSDPVFRGSAQLQPATRYDAYLTDPVMWEQPGRISFNAGTQCPMVYRDGGGWQDICPGGGAGGTGVGEFWSESDGGAYLYPTAGTTERVKVGVDHTDTTGTKLLVTGAYADESLVSGIVAIKATGTYATLLHALDIWNPSAASTNGLSVIYWQMSPSGKSGADGVFGAHGAGPGTMFEWLGYPGSASLNDAGLQTAVRLYLNNGAAGQLRPILYPPNDTTNSSIGWFSNPGSIFPWGYSLVRYYSAGDGTTVNFAANVGGSLTAIWHMIDQDFYPSTRTGSIGMTRAIIDLYLSSMVRFTASAPTSVAGAVWYDSTELQHKAHEAIGAKVLSGRFCVTTADSSAVANTVTETAFDSISCSIGANGVAAGTTFRAKAFVSYGTDASVAPALTLRVKVGGTTYCSIATSLETGSSGVFASVECRFTVRTTGAGGTALASGESIVNLASSASIATALGNASTVAIDTTAANAVTVTAQWDTADADDTATLQQFSLEAM